MVTGRDNVHYNPRRSAMTTISRDYRVARQEVAREANRGKAEGKPARLGVLLPALADPSKRVTAAQMIMSEFGREDLGVALYHRCYRILNPTSDPLLAKVRGRGKPGAMSKAEAKEYRNRDAIRRALGVIDKFTD
jgi:hypothetical protein